MSTMYTHICSMFTQKFINALFMFPLADLEKMNSLERISFLQEKLQDIRNHYLSLKSEVASIDRRRKRMKKKERESESLIARIRLPQLFSNPLLNCEESPS